MENSFEIWVKKKIHLAESLEKGKCESDYSDAVIFLCVIISAMASNLWKEKNIDRKRFIELLVNYSNKYSKINFISIPLLYQNLKKASSKKEENIILIERKFPRLTTWSSEILISNDIDCSEDSLTDIGLTPKEIREFSYACIIYEKLRCGLVHEYYPEELVTIKPLTSYDADISYNNCVHKIHFHFKWLIELVNAVVENTKDYIEKINQLPTPSNWWIDGK